MKDQNFYDYIKINGNIYSKNGDKINLNNFINEFIGYIESKGMVCFASYNGLDYEDDYELDG